MPYSLNLCIKKDKVKTEIETEVGDPQKNSNLDLRLE